MTGHARLPGTACFRVAAPLALWVAAGGVAFAETPATAQPNTDVIGRIIALGAPQSPFAVSTPADRNAFPPEILQRMREALIKHAENPQSGTKTRKND
ncbi:MAG: hypothetical protein ACNA7O_04080 [Rhodobacterales bacterium]